MRYVVVFFFQAEDGIRDLTVTGVQTCALPISPVPGRPSREPWRRRSSNTVVGRSAVHVHSRAAQSKLFDLDLRSEEHTSELQSQSNLVCRLLLEKKNIDGAMRQHLPRLRMEHP